MRRTRSGGRRGAPGFSLAELLTVLAIAAAMTAIALPDLRQMVRQQQLKAAASDLSGALNLARSMAIARNGQVHLVPLEAAGADWSGGWIVFVDRDGDRRPGGTEEVFMRHGPLAKGIAVGAAFARHRSPDYIAYNGAGRSCFDTGGLASRPGTLSLFQGEQTRRIKINLLGRVRMCDPAAIGADCEGGDAP